MIKTITVIVEGNPKVGKSLLIEALLPGIKQYLVEYPRVTVEVIERDKRRKSA